MARRLAILALAAAAFLAPARGEGADRLRVLVWGSAQFDSGVALHFADTKGFFAREGIAVETSHVRSGTRIVQILIAGEADLAPAVPILAPIAAFSRGAPVRIVSAQMTGGALYWFARHDAGIRDSRDFDGKTVGHTLVGTLPHLAALDLQAHSRRDLRLSPTGRMSDSLTQVLSGQIDIGFGVPPYGLSHVYSGALVIVARGADLPRLGGRTTRVGIAHARFLRERRDVVIRFLRAFHGAIDWMFRHPIEATGLYASLNHIELDVANFATGFYRRRDMMPGTIRGLDATLRLAIRFGFIHRPFSADELAELVDIVYAPEKG